MATMRWGRLKPARVASLGTGKEPVFPHPCRFATRMITSAAAPRMSPNLSNDRPGWRDRTVLVRSENAESSPRDEPASTRSGAALLAAGPGDWGFMAVSVLGGGGRALHAVGGGRVPRWRDTPEGCAEGSVQVCWPGGRTAGGELHHHDPPARLQIGRAPPRGAGG